MCDLVTVLQPPAAINHQITSCYMIVICCFLQDSVEVARAAPFVEKLLALSIDYQQQPLTAELLPCSQV
jgi:hypothetical protein